MDASQKQDHALIAAASTHARDAHDYCHDIAAMLFPRAVNAPSEEMITAVRTKMLALVAGIEADLTGSAASSDGKPPQCWPMLSRSGFLGETDLVDFMLARVAEDRIEQRFNQITDNGPPALLVGLLSDENPQISDAARSLMAADSLHRHIRGQNHHALRPEMLHRLCWRVVAVLEVEQGERNAQVVENARRLLASYDEAKTVEALARRLVHLLGPEKQDLLDIERSGLHLFVAALAAALAMEHDHLLRLIDGPSAAPLATMLRARGVSPDTALSTIYHLKGFSLTPQDIHQFENGYADLDRAVARAEIAKWTTERAQLLLADGGRS